MTRRYRHLVLIGMNGHWEDQRQAPACPSARLAFWDNDAALQQATGQTAAEVQHARGQDALHEIEDRLLVP